MLWRRPRKPVGSWVASLVLVLGLAGFSFLAAPWGGFGLPVRYALLLLFLLAVACSLRRPLTEETTSEPPMRTLVKVMLGLFFGGVAVGALRGHAVPAGAIDLLFPLGSGTYLVAHGGSSGPSNMHAPQVAQRYAVDLVKLNGVGMRAWGIYPQDLSRHAIFGTEVLSPCAGVVVTAADGWPDELSAVRDVKKPFGNHVVVRCGEVNVTLAHLRRGSVAISSGETIAPRQLLGRTGNSGLSSEPHLHVHADRGGKAVAVRFDGEWLVRNDVIRR